ncbi:MAG TPA: hypothetical protein VGE59_03295 [Patescibacteria group bacterium]
MTIQEPLMSQGLTSATSRQKKKKTHPNCIIFFFLNLNPPHPIDASLKAAMSNPGPLAAFASAL